jgi:hypothetical protein
MGCGCGGTKNKSQEWVYAFRGQTKVYKTEIEARAAQIRNGGGTITPRAKTG